MNKKEILVNPPYNIGNDICLFKRRKYYVSELQTFYLKDVLVTNNGICFKNSKIIPGSIQEYPDKIRIFEFTSISAEQFSLYEQISFSKKIKYLISNGSGLTNMHFMNKQSTVMELFKKKTNINDFHDLVIWYLASALGLKYFYQQCSPVNKKMDMFRADLFVDIKTLCKNVNRMLLNKA